MSLSVCLSRPCWKAVRKPGVNGAFPVFLLPFRCSPERRDTHIRFGGQPADQRNHTNDRRNQLEKDRFATALCFGLCFILQDRKSLERNRFNSSLSSVVILAPNYKYRRSVYLTAVEEITCVLELCLSGLASPGNNFLLCPQRNKRRLRT